MLSSLQFAYFQEIHALEKVAPAIKVIVWDCVFWPWAARGLSGSFEHVIDCCQDYNSHVSKKFEPWKKLAPAVKVIVWDCDFLALGGQRPFWEL